MRSSSRRRLLTCVAVGAAMATIGAGPASAAPDQIAYRCDVDVCLVNPDAPGVTNLSANGATSFEDAPSWSPDGSKVAFLSTFGSVPGRNIFVMNPDAPGNAVNLATQLTFFTNDGGYVTDPVWSRDGTRIAFERKTNLVAKTGVYVVKSDGTSVQPVTVTTDGAHPTWSPDGTTIAYSTGEQVYLAAADGSGAPTPLTNGAGHDPVWSPDGTRIAFDTINVMQGSPLVDLHVARVDGSGTPVVTIGNYTQWTFAAWSPDAARIAYRSTTANDGHIRVVGVDGTSDQPLASVAGENDYEPTWSPDGGRVAFHGYQYSGPTPVNEIFVASTTDGTGVPRAITTGGKDSAPAWRPDPSRAPVVPVVPTPTPTPDPGAPAPAPSPGSPAPVPTRKPTVVWITGRAPYVPGFPIFVGVYGCGGPRCNVGAKGTTSVAPVRTASSASASGAKRRRPATITIARGHIVVPSDSTRRLKLTLTRAGAALLRRRGSVSMKVTVTTTGADRPRTVEQHQVRVYLKAKRR